MPTDATLRAEVDDLMAKWANVTDPDLKQAIQDRIDFIEVQRGRSPVYGAAKGVTKFNSPVGKK